MRQDGNKTNQKAKILAVAKQMISTDGYKGASLQKIMDKVGIHKTTFFHYYKNKEELLDEILSGPITQALNMLKSIRGNNMLAPEEKLKLAIENHLEWLLNNQDAANIYHNDFRSLPRNSLELYYSERKLFANFLCDIVAEIQSSDRIRSFDGLDTKIVTYGILGMCNWSVRWYRKNGPYTPMDISNIFYSMLVK